MKKGKKTHWLLFTILVLAVCAVAGLILSAVLFFRDPGPTYASATLELTFEGAAAGVAPNGTAFDLRDLVSDEVLSEGLKAASLEGTYTPEQIRGSLSVRGVYPEDLANQVMSYESLLSFTTVREMSVGDYHPTTFHLRLVNDFDKSISRDRLKALLGGITDSYRAYFAKVYSYGLSLDNIVFELDDYDYPQQLSIIEGRLTAVSGYAKELYERAPAFRFRGMGFNDVSVSLDALIENKITRLNADLTINALTRDTDRLLTQYRYQILDLGIQRDKQKQELDKLDKLIASYEKNEIIYLSTADSLTKIDGNSSETYDALVKRRKKVADGITELVSRISGYEMMITDLLTSTGALRPEAVEAIRPEEETNGGANGGEAAGGEETGSDEGTASEEGTLPAEEPGQMTAAEIEENQRRISSQRALLEENIRMLVAEGDDLIAELQEMLENYNAQQINEKTIAVTGPSYKEPKLLSGTFAAQAVKTAGPVVAIGFMLCMVMIVISRGKEEKRRK